jgi:Fic family protein
MNALEKAEQLKQELDPLRPLDAEAEARIMQKFRLDWNYHSNNLEGNSLTYGETKALILFGITAQGKPLKDHFEITGHNEAINWILEIIKDETPLNEKFIRELHTLLLKESSYKEAQTAEGKPTRRKIEVGKYKTQPNHVVTVTGETFYFATPEETPAKMHELIEWFRNEKEKQGVNPIILAALFHYRFIRIHPFDDGNGRTARILMNFILMQFGYPPVIIKTEDKENYFAVLRLADADELEPFVEYIAKNLVHSLEIMIKGAKGENIDEPDDLDKELALLEGKLRNRGKTIKSMKSKEMIVHLINNSLMRLFSELIKTCEKFDKFYLKKNLLSKITSSKFVYYPEIEDENLSSLKREINSSETGLDIYKILLTYEHLIFNREGFEHFNRTSSIYIHLGKTSYQIKSEYIRTTDLSIEYEKLYSDDLTDVEIQKLINDISKRHLEFIETKIENKN